MSQAEAKKRLLDAAVEYVTEHGLGDLGFRRLARELGTSHRMLGYHFGSKEGLLVEIVRTVEERQRQVLAALVVDETADPREQMRWMAARLSDPALWPSERLFFELYGQALQGRPHAVRLLPEVVDAWLGPLTELSLRLGVPADDAPAHARLLLAVSRGLLLDLLATGERDAIARASDLFFDRYERPRD
ncbi:TetR/AcrR family transcriptional regulator [Actinomadura fibrosa]|uniref:TetR/AcrR family transcriptional regulator n=1 Tax=Actinomadura fibrosa TaxID=111802 RepID=A0ABW2XFH4_9ACTN|nr:TetR/AcrR family transcriptional regulator [Actinomadura fibrosa]